MDQLWQELSEIAQEYGLPPAREVEFKILLRPHQRRAYDRPQRFQVEVWHRRSGKSYKARAKMLARALTSRRKDHRGYLIGPTYAQTKRIHWDALKAVGLQIPGAGVNESELRLDLPNGARIQLLGAENADSLRGA